MERLRHGARAPRRPLLAAATVLAVAGLTAPASALPPFDTERQEALSAHALAAPAEVTGSVSALAAYLVQPARDDTERLWLIFRWLAENVDYDVAGFLSGAPGPTTPEAVLRSRTSVCEGYSSLCAALGKAAGLEMEIVHGWAKGFGYRVGAELPARINHAWNAVKIDGTWQLLDGTWGAGDVGREGRFERRFDPYHFLVPPAEMIYDHFPEEERWQLLETPLTAEEFVRLPTVHTPYFTLGLGLVSHREATISTGSSLAVALTVPAGISLTARLRRDGADLPRRLTFTQPDGDIYQVLAVLPAAGDYELVVFAGKGGEELDAAVEYRVQATEGVGEGVEFPAVHAGFLETGAALVEPLSGHLAAGAEARFDLYVPGASRVALINGDAWVMLDGGADGRYYGSMAPQAGRVLVAAQFAGEDRFSGLVSYDVP
jgi:hypothetical protein